MRRRWWRCSHSLCGKWSWWRWNWRCNRFYKRRERRQGGDGVKGGRHWPQERRRNKGRCHGRWRGGNMLVLRRSFRFPHAVDDILRKLQRRVEEKFQWNRD